MAQYNNSLGLNNRGCFEKLKIVVSSAKHVSFIYLCKKSDMSLIHLPTNSTVT